MGKFVSEDPMEGENNVPLSWRSYLYANGNPLVYIDKTGMSACFGDPGACDTDADKARIREEHETYRAEKREQAKNADTERARKYWADKQNQRIAQETTEGDEGKTDLKEIVTDNIPVYGSGRSAYRAYKDGHWVYGMAFAGMAVAEGASLGEGAIETAPIKAGMKARLKKIMKKEAEEAAEKGGAKGEQKAASDALKQEAKTEGEVAAGNATGKSLLPTEGNVGTYDELLAAGSKGDNITPHHIPSANNMAKSGVAKGDGIAINMEQPHPGVGGRHRETFTYGSTADVNMSPRDALAAGVWDARRIYMEDGLYGSQIRSSLQELIRQNKTTFPGVFQK